MQSLACDLSLQLVFFCFSKALRNQICCNRSGATCLTTWSRWSRSSIPSMRKSWRWRKIRAFSPQRSSPWLKRKLLRRKARWPWKALRKAAPKRWSGWALCKTKRRASTIERDIIQILRVGLFIWDLVSTVRGCDFRGSVSCSTANFEDCRRVGNQKNNTHNIYIYK